MINILGVILIECFFMYYRVYTLKHCEIILLHSYNINIFVHHVAHQSTIGDLKSHLKQQGFDVENMRIDVTSNLAATYKSFRIITSGNLRKSLLDAKVWPVGVWVRDYETFSQSRLHKRSNNQGGQFNNQNGS